MLLYRLLATLLAAATLLRALRRGGRAALRARLTPGAAPPGRHVWLHGASNGELASARPVLERLVAARPDLHWLVTSNSTTGVDLVRGWALPRVSVRPAPLDLAWVNRRLWRDWQVIAHVTLEAEIWPHRVLGCPGPVILLGARMSAGTARGWARLQGLARRVLGAVNLASAQDPASRDRLAALGLPPAAQGPVVDLKAFYTPPVLARDPAAETFDRTRTWLAASTHPGEEEIVLDAHRLAREKEPGLRLILAPRHPDRAEAIQALITARGLSCARRSEGEPPGAAEVYLADSLGEMARWYAAAGRVLVGGTLTDRGGHTPYEPAAFGAALIHGPDRRNFAAARDALRAAGADLEIRDAAGLAEALNALSDPAEQARLGAAQAAALAPEAGPEALVEALLGHLPAPSDA